MNQPIVSTQKIDFCSLTDLNLIESIPFTGIEYPFQINYPVFDKKANDFEKLYTMEQ